MAYLNKFASVGRALSSRYHSLSLTSVITQCFVGTDHLRTKIIINDETLEQVNQFTYLGCSISYQFSNDIEYKFAKFLQLIGTIKRTIFRKRKLF
jgi:hypothetical protein